MSAPRKVPTNSTDLAAVEAAYRRALWTIIGHGVFFVVCCAIAVIVRRMMKMPPALLTVVILVALLLFGSDIWRFFAYRRQLRRLRETDST